MAAAAPSTTAPCCTCSARCSTSRSAPGSTGSGAAELPHPRRRADRLRLRGPAVVRGLPRRRGRGRPDRQGGPGGGGPAHRRWRRLGAAGGTGGARGALLAEQYKDSGSVRPTALAKRLAPLDATEREEARKQAARRHRRRLSRWPSGCCRSTASSAHGPARPAGGDPARRAVRHRVGAAARTPAPTTRRGSWPSRSSRARWSRWSTTPGPLQTADESQWKPKSQPTRSWR